MPFEVEPPAQALARTRYLSLLLQARYALQEQRFFASTLRRVLPRLTRTLTRPGIGELFDIGGMAHTSAATALGAILGHRFDPDLYDSYEAEYGALAEELSRRYSDLALSGGTIRPQFYALEDDTGLLVYCLLRFLQPSLVLETGVANGHSTFLALRAMAANGAGAVYSTDIDTDSGQLLDANDKKPWKFRLLRRSHLRADFDKVLSEVGTVPFFFHDSEHTYAWQMREYEAAWASRSLDSLLLSDDIDASYAFCDFCTRKRLRPVVFLDKRKFVGVVPLIPAKDRSQAT
jgi:Methyltransferase domain